MFRQKQTKAMEAVSKSKLAGTITKVKNAKKTAKTGHKVKSVMPYSAWDSILLVGEGTHNSPLVSYVYIDGF